MTTEDILNKLKSIIGKLDDKGLFAEAEKLQKEFEKISKKAKERFIDEPAQAILDNSKKDVKKLDAKKLLKDSSSKMLNKEKKC